MNESRFPQLVRTAVEVLERIQRDRALLAQLSPEELTRLLQAAGDVFCPDVSERRRLVKARSRQRKAEKLERDDALLNETGIRSLRRKPVFTTPNLSPPPVLEADTIADGAFKEVTQPQNCYICKQA